MLLGVYQIVALPKQGCHSKVLRTCVQNLALVAAQRRGPSCLRALIGAMTRNAFLLSGEIAHAGLLAGAGPAGAGTAGAGPPPLFPRPPPPPPQSKLVVRNEMDLGFLVFVRCSFFSPFISCLSSASSLPTAFPLACLSPLPCCSLSTYFASLQGSIRQLSVDF